MSRRDLAMIAVAVGSHAEPARVVDTFRRRGLSDPAPDGECLVGLISGDDEGSAAERCLELALALRDLSAGSPRPGVACSLLPSPNDPGAERVEREPVVEWVGRWPGRLVVTGDFRGVRLDQRLEPLAGSLRALYALEPAAEPALRPIGRWVVPDGVEWTCEGGLLARRPEGAVDLTELVRRGESQGARRVLVVGDAWLGKTYVAKKLYDALVAAGVPVHATWLEDRVPSWPAPSFFAEPTGGHRIWLVDSADEWLHQGRAFDVKLAAGPADSTTLVFARPDDSFDALQSGLGGPEVWRLLPLSRDQLGGLRGGEQDEVSALVERASAIVNGERGVALSPAELIELASVDPQLGLTELRRRLVRRRCTTPRGTASPVEHPEDVFEAAKSLAAASIFSDISVFRFGDGNDGFFVADAVRQEQWPAARALERSRVLVPSGGVHRFAARHLAEDLAALAVVDALGGGAGEGEVEERIGALDGAGLRNLFSDGLGLRPELSRVWERVSEMRPDVPSTHRVDDADALALYRALEDRARRSPDTRLDPPYAAIAALSTDGVKALVKLALDEASNAEPARLELALHTAFHHEWDELAEACLRWASDPRLPPEVREWAVELGAVTLGKEPERQSLADSLERLADQLVAEPTETLVEDPADQPRPTEPTSFAESGPRVDLLVTIARAMLKAGRWSALEATRRIPWGSSAAYHRHRLLPRLRERLTLIEARKIVDAIEEQLEAPHVRELASDASLCVLEGLDQTLTPDDGARVLRIERCLHRLETTVRKKLNDLVNERADVRRWIFEHGVLASGSSFVALERSADELDWLLGVADRYPAEWPEALAPTIASLVLDLDAKLPEVVRALTLLDDRGQGHTVEALRARRRELDEQLARWRDEDRKRSARSPAVRIEEWAERLEESRDRKESASQRVWRVGEVLVELYPNLAGKFEDLSVEARAKVVRWVREALVEATPTGWPRTNMIPGRVVFEAEAFSLAATFERGEGWLTAELVARWLPTALRGIARTEATLIELCLDVAPEATSRAVVDALALSAETLGVGETHFIPRRLLESPGFRRAHRELLHRLAATDDENVHRALPRLLASFLECSEGGSVSGAGQLVEALANGRHTLQRRLTGVWFAHDPNGAVDALIALARTSEDLVTLLEPAARRRWSDHALISRYGPGTRASLLRLALDLVPGDEWGSMARGIITDRMAVIDLLEHLAWETIGRHDEEALREAVDALRASPFWAERLERAVADAELRAELASLGRRSPPTPVEVGRVLRGSLRLIRDSYELALVVSRVLATPGWTEREFRLLEDEGVGPRHEKFVQSLLEILILSWQRARPTSPTIVVREPLEAGANRSDFVVHATTPGGRVSVPVEVKWAHNQKWKEGLEEQLVQRYLVNAKRTHGIFFVVDRDPAKAESRRATIESRVADVSSKGAVHVHLVYQSRPSLR